MRPPNYHQARKQKELSRKLRQDEKQQRRMARINRTNETSTPGEAGPGADRPADTPASTK
jgi:hypothetical protein